jgi:hypothetical protein
VKMDAFDGDVMYLCFRFAKQLKSFERGCLYLVCQRPELWTISRIAESERPRMTVVRVGSVCVAMIGV